jgi:hypothetical protein
MLFLLAIRFKLFLIVVHLVLSDLVVVNIVLGIIRHLSHRWTFLETSSGRMSVLTEFKVSLSILFFEGVS